SAPPPTPTLFPYTTLFRSPRDSRSGEGGDPRQKIRAEENRADDCRAQTETPVEPVGNDALHDETAGEGVEREERRQTRDDRFGRSEEHTSGLQSRGHLVCR